MDMNKKQITLRQYEMEFIKFLKQHNAYESFKKNLRQDSSLYASIVLNPFDRIARSYRHIEDECQRERNIICALERVIDFSFLWVGTKEGHEFWRKLNSEWMNYSREHFYITIYHNNPSES